MIQLRLTVICIAIPYFCPPSDTALMHSNAGTLGGIVGRTCTNGAFYEKEWNLGQLARREFT